MHALLSHVSVLIKIYCSWVKRVWWEILRKLQRLDSSPCRSKQKKSFYSQWTWFSYWSRRFDVDIDVFIQKPMIYFFKAVVNGFLIGASFSSLLNTFSIFNLLGFSSGRMVPMLSLSLSLTMVTIQLVTGLPLWVKQYNFIHFKILNLRGVWSKVPQPMTLLQTVHDLNLCQRSLSHFLILEMLNLPFF